MKNLSVAIVIVGLLLHNASVLSQNNWPKEILAKSGEGKITIYQPQPESFVGVKLTGRWAVSVRLNSTAEPVLAQCGLKQR